MTWYSCSWFHIPGFHSILSKLCLATQSSPSLTFLYSTKPFLHLLSFINILYWISLLHLPIFILKSLKECKLMSASFFFMAMAKSAIVTIWLSVASFSWNAYSFYFIGMATSYKDTLNTSCVDVKRGKGWGRAIQQHSYNLR